MTERCEDVTVAAHVVQTRTSVNVGDVLQEDTKFPAGIGKRGKEELTRDWAGMGMKYCIATFLFLNFILFNFFRNSINSFLDNNFLYHILCHIADV